MAKWAESVQVLLPAWAQARIGMTTASVSSSSVGTMRAGESGSWRLSLELLGAHHGDGVEQIAGVERDLHRLAGVVDVELLLRLSQVGVAGGELAAGPGESSSLTARVCSVESTATRRSA